MQHFPIFLNLAGRRVVVAGGDETALAKLRLLLKTDARLTVIAPDPIGAIDRLEAEGRLTILRRDQEPGDALCAALFYAAWDDAEADARAARLARADGALANIVDNLADSQFITPAIVDRDPVVVAIGTEGAAPVLARSIKKHLEEYLAPSLGLAARLGKRFRKAVEVLPAGAKRRAFWSDFYGRTGPAAAGGGEEAVRRALSDTLDAHVTAGTRPGEIAFVGAGPGDPDLLTLKARKALDTADVVIHDRLVPQPILELARREALMIDVGKQGFGPATDQKEIDRLLVEHGRAGAQVVRLKSGDPCVFGRLEEEIRAVEAAGIAYRVVPGITAASAAAAQIGRSLTERGRNSSLRLIAGHDAQGFTEHDWAALARPGEVAGIYMGKRAARFIQGRLMMHDADPSTPVSVVENASRPDARVIATTLATLEPDITEAGLDGPALLLLGLSSGRCCQPFASHRLAGNQPLAGHAPDVPSPAPIMVPATAERRS